MTLAEAEALQAQRNREIQAARAIIKKQVTPELLRILKKRFNYHLPVFQKGNDHKLDPLTAACMDGTHEVIKWLEYELEQNTPLES